MSEIQIKDPQFSTIEDPHVDILDITINIITSDNYTYSYSTELYIKPAQRNCKLYLPPVSFHQPHIFTNWIINNILRLRTLCSVDETYLKCLDSFKQDLIIRAYSVSSVDKIFDEFSNQDRNILIYNQWIKRNSLVTDSTSPLCLCTTYIPFNTNAFSNSILEPNNEIYERDHHFKSIFEIKPRIVYRNLPNLQRQLTRVKR